jgi:malate dehydrogenase (oxaloacetate-decarboxylating)
MRCYTIEYVCAGELQGNRVALTGTQLILGHLKEMFPVIYTPTEGEAIADYSRLFRKPEGCFLNIEDADRVEDDIIQWGHPDDIDLIVVSDGEQILGIGDQGVGAILISVAKLVIYTLCAGIHPSRTLPVVVDCGTDVRVPQK